MVSACRKGIEFDQQYIRGRAFMTDTITGIKKDIPLNNKRILISTGDTLNYLYTAQTDPEGYFVFNLLSDKNTSYMIYAFDTVGVVYYSGIVKAERGAKDVRLHLYPNPNIQNGIVLYAKDPQNAILPSVKYKIYNNATLAFANTSTDFIAVQADTSGKGYKLNLPAGDYWVNAEKTIDTLFYQRIGKKITVSSSGFIIDTMMLFKKNSVNGLNITLIENGNIPVAGAEVRIYNNLSMAQINDPAAMIATDISGANGKINRFNLPTGTYYLNAYKQVGNDTFRRVAKLVTLTATSIITDTMFLFKTSAPVNGYRLQSKDSLGGILPVSTLYLYNSELLALQNSPTGAGFMLTTPTDLFGFGGHINLPAGDYYVNARRLVDTVLYERVAKKITITATGIVTDTIQLRRRW
jgi:hypothetical protein